MAIITREWIQFYPLNEVHVFTPPTCRLSNNSLYLDAMETFSVKLLLLLTVVCRTTKMRRYINFLSNCLFITSNCNFDKGGLGLNHCCKPSYCSCIYSVDFSIQWMNEWATRKITELRIECCSNKCTKLTLTFIMCLHNSDVRVKICFFSIYIEVQF